MNLSASHHLLIVEKCENQEHEILEQQLLSEDLLDIMELAETDLSVESHTQHGIVQIGVHRAYK